MNEIPYTMTGDSVTVVYEGKQHTVKQGAANYLALRKALYEERWGAVPDHLTVAKAIVKWARGNFSIVGDRVVFEGQLIPEKLSLRIMQMAQEGVSPEPLLRFWERLQLNPSWRSVQMLWDFMNHANIPLTEDGCFLAYKGVTRNYRDVHTRRVDNSIGVINEMPRNKISDDPAQACHYGFHVGSQAYATDFAGNGRTVICKVDPADVVCVPNDSGQGKMRVCRYQVIGNYGEPLPSTIISDKDMGVPSKKAPAKPKPPKALKTIMAKTKKAAPAPASWSELDHMDRDGLMHQGIVLLRNYAGKKLKIVGAYKMLGGKAALVNAIIKTRG